MQVLVFETALGHTAFARTDDRLLGLSFGHANQRSVIRALKATAETPQNPFEDLEFIGPGEDELADRLCRFALGETCSFDELVVDTSHLTPFGKKVIESCRQIPWGETVTYGQLAQQVGRAGAARAVGSVMARNRVPLIVPCHRVVPACGGLGGFSAPQGVSMKKRLLEMERTASLQEVELR